MSRSGLSDDCDEQWMFAAYRGRVSNATRGKRGQKFYREMLAALDAMPKQELHAEVFDESADGKVCALGALCRVKGIDTTEFDPEDDYAAEVLAGKLDVADCLTREVIYWNDEGGHNRYIHLEHRNLHGEWSATLLESPYERWQRMRAWVAKQIKDDALLKARSLNGDGNE